MAGLGVILHSAMETAEGIDEESLWRVVEARWGELEFDAAVAGAPVAAPARATSCGACTRYLGSFEASGGTLLGRRAALRDPARVRSGCRATGAPGIVRQRLHRPRRADRRGAGRHRRPEDRQEGAADRREGRRQPAARRVPAGLRVRAHHRAPRAPRPAERSCSSSCRPSAPVDFVSPPSRPSTTSAAPRSSPRVAHGRHDDGGRSPSRAPYEEHCRKDHSYGLCRIHTVRAVSAS